MFTLVLQKLKIVIISKNCNCWGYNFSSVKDYFSDSKNEFVLWLISLICNTDLLHCFHCFPLHQVK